MDAPQPHLMFLFYTFAALIALPAWRAPMPKKKQTTRAGTSATKIRTTAALTKRIEQWSAANSDDAHAETMRQLLSRSLRLREPKAQRTKT
jgi:hypothetical protein